MKNVLFIGPYNQQDGWGIAAKKYVKALIAADCNLTIKPVYLANTVGIEDESLYEFENTKYDHYDVVIQNTLPSLFRYYGGSKNIGLCYFETTIKGTPWVSSINMMDEMWVTSDFEVNLLHASGVDDVAVHIIPIPMVEEGDLEKYAKSYEYKDIDEHKDEFKFYFIGEYITRKNLQALVVAFNAEFDCSEQVRLIIKTNMRGKEPEEVLSTVNNDINDIKSKCKLYHDVSMYKNEILITVRLTDEELLSLHDTCDCFVMPSRGESFCIPAFDAMAFGSYPIYVDQSGIGEYIYGNQGAPVTSTKVPCICDDRPTEYLYTSRDTWEEVDILNLQYNMRMAFNRKSRPDKQLRKEWAAKNVLPRYTSQAIAKIIQERLIDHEKLNG